MDEKQLLEEARRRYPAGTKYFPVHLGPARDRICTVYDPERFYLTDSAIQESSGDMTKNGHDFSEIIYYKEQWAVISEVAQLPKLELYQIF